MRHSTRSWTFALATAGLGVLLLGHAGCNIIGPAIYFIAGPEKVPAAFVLDKDKPTVVIVDDPGSRIPEQVLRLRAARVASQTLLDNKVVVEVIGSESAAAVVARERFGQPMGTVDIGQAVGAKTVVYALVEEFTLQSQPGVYSPRASVRIKVADVESRKRVFPPEDQGMMPLTTDLPVRQGSPPQSAADINRAWNELADTLGEAIAKVFFEHALNETGERLDTRAKDSHS